MRTTGRAHRPGGSRGGAGRTVSADRANQWRSPPNIAHLLHASFRTFLAAVSFAFPLPPQFKSGGQRTSASINTMSANVGLLILTLALVLPANGQFGKVLEGLSNRGEASDSKSASGLKEALQIGTDHAVDLTGTTDGFFKNEAIKILLPDKLKTAEKGLRLAGMGPKIDEFELSMNRAAEKAAPAARSIFKDARCR